MKFLIASDIHGSEKYCRMALEIFEREKCDRMLLLGDLLYHGPRNDLPDGYAPKAVIPLLNGYKDRILAVRGNCEAEVDQMVLDFPVMADYAAVAVGEKLLYMTHGHAWGPGRLPPLKKGDVLLSGHTHIPVCAEKEGVLLLNPGSVSIPKAGSARSVMLFDGETFVWIDIETGSAYKTYTI